MTLKQSVSSILFSGFVLFALVTTGCTASASQSLPTVAVTAVIDAADSQPGQQPAEFPTPLPPTNTPAGSITPDPSPTSDDASAGEAISPTATPTSLPQLAPSLAITTPLQLLEGVPTPATAMPTAVATFQAPRDTTNVLLLGSDRSLDAAGARTDAMIIVAINRSGPTASVISLPRDLYVYQPGSIMDRLNTAYSRGGIELLKQTILYNFGVPIHYYARVDFESFKEIVDIMGGVDLAVSCRLQDWRLKSPELNIHDEESWEQFALEPGVHHMDGDLALWYVRSRRTTSDFDRGRRQQQLLRAMLAQGVDLGLISQAPGLWEVYRSNVETDMDIGRMLQLAALAPTVRQNGVQHLYLAGKTESWTTPDGAQVQLPIWEGDRMMQETFSRLFLLPALNQAVNPPVRVEIINATNNPDLAILAAENLAWHGFVPVIGAADPQPDAVTLLQLNRPNFKDSYDWLISWIFNVNQSAIELISEPGYQYDYRVIIGQNYDPCRPELFAPLPFIN